VSHGGKREGAGRKPSRESRSVPKSIKVSREVADYLAEHGTGIIENLIRKSKKFKVWQIKRQPRHEEINQ
jgi:hypothetical protein